MGVNKQIIDEEEASEVVFDYVPNQFPISINQSAKDFVSSQEEKSSKFQINELSASQSGVADLNQKLVEKRVEIEALEKLKELEERAYGEAYELGLIEGTEKAFNENFDSLKERIEKLDDLIKTFEEIKVQLIEGSETQILKLISLMANRLAMDHVEINQEIILQVIRQVIETAQTDENVVLKLSEEDSLFIEGARERMGKKLDFLKRVKIEPIEEVKSGGCILETQFGAIDATIEQRFSKVWETIQAKMPIVEKGEISYQQDQEESVDDNNDDPENDGENKE